MRESHNLKTPLEELERRARGYRSEADLERRAQMPTVLVVYFSGTGNTRAMAEAIGEGAKAAGAEAIVKGVEETSVDDLIAADAIAFGSPTYFGYMAGVLKALFDRAWGSRNKMAGKPFAAFTSGGGGQARALQSIEGICDSFRLRKACPSVAVSGMPTESQKQACRGLGAALVRVMER